MTLLQPVLGIALFLGLAWLLGGANRAVSAKRVAIGLALQFGLAVLLLRVPLLRDILGLLNRAVGALNNATERASGFMFGYLGGAPSPFVESGEGSTYIIAFRVLPLILVVSAISAVLFYWGVLPRIVRGFSWVLSRTLGLSGPLSVSAASSLFLGIIEAPLLIRPYLARMSSSDLLAMMTCVMSTVAGSVMVLYASVLSPVLPGALSHIITASVISIPAALTIAHLVSPSFGDEVTANDDGEHTLVLSSAKGTMDALMQGTQEGLSMVLQVVASIIVLFALVHLSNTVLGIIPLEAPLTLQGIAGWCLRPLMWLIGIPWAETHTAGQLMGTKTILNEFVAYLELSQMSGEFSDRSRLIVTYALCGFANLGSLGILVG
ncbi:MAG: nucleoside transporter C-terminal domain-containing protein, partial [Myxococcota bacterium]